MKKASLVVAGSGIKFISHLTTEVKTYIEQSEKILYLVNEPAMKEWIEKNNPNTESLDNLYTQHSLRLHCYKAITKYILETLHKNQHVCVILYGHPTVFAIPALDAVIQAKQEGYDTKVLPGISAEDCLFAELLINPASHGCQSYEATDFLIRRRVFEPHCHLILWQIGRIGVLNHKKSHDNKKGAKILINYLTQFYPDNHPVTLYEAAQYPYFNSRIDKIPLSELPEQVFSPISTLYIPPKHKAPYDLAILKALDIDIKDLR